MSRGNEPVGIKAETMSDKPAYLTREGRAKLEAELEDLIINGRKVVAERIGAAKELGDISESGEYEDGYGEDGPPERERSERPAFRDNDRGDRGPRRDDRGPRRDDRGPRRDDRGGGGNRGGGDRGPRR